MHQPQQELTHPGRYWIECASLYSAPAAHKIGGKPPAAPNGGDMQEWRREERERGDLGVAESIESSIGSVDHMGQGDQLILGLEALQE